MVTAEVGLEPTVGHGGRGKTEGKEGRTKPAGGVKIKAEGKIK